MSSLINLYASKKVPWPSVASKILPMHIPSAMCESTCGVRGEPWTGPYEVLRPTAILCASTPLGVQALIPPIHISIQHTSTCKQNLAVEMAHTFHGPQLMPHGRKKKLNPWTGSNSSHGILSLLLIRVACLLRPLKVWAFRVLLCSRALYVDSLCLGRKRDQAIWKRMFEDYWPEIRKNGFKLWTGLKSACTGWMLDDILSSQQVPYFIKQLFGYARNASFLTRKKEKRSASFLCPQNGQC